MNLLLTRRTNLSNSSYAFAQIGFSLSFLLALRYFIWDRMQREHEASASAQAPVDDSQEQRASRRGHYAVAEAGASGGASERNPAMDELAIQIEDETRGVGALQPAALEPSARPSATSPGAQSAGYMAIPLSAPSMYEEAGPVPSHTASTTPVRQARSNTGQASARQPRISVFQAIVATATDTLPTSKPALRAMPSVVSTMDSPSDHKSADDREAVARLTEPAEYAAKIVAPFGKGAFLFSPHFIFANLRLLLTNSSPAASLIGFNVRILNTITC